jgi:site-specific DNA recombinase
VEIRRQQDDCLHDIALHQAADQDYLEQGVRLLTLAQKGRKLFDEQRVEKKRDLLKFVLSNSSWKAGTLSATFRQPFNLIAETAAAAATAAAEKGQNFADRTAWLPGPDSNQRPTG